MYTKKRDSKLEGRGEKVKEIIMGDMKNRPKLYRKLKYSIQLILVGALPLGQ
jgi:hypothetical protein